MRTVAPEGTTMEEIYCVIVPFVVLQKILKPGQPALPQGTFCHNGIGDTSIRESLSSHIAF